MVGILSFWWGPNFVLANKQQFESIEGGPKEEFGDVRTRKKKKTC